MKRIIPVLAAIFVFLLAGCSQVAQHVTGGSLSDTGLEKCRAQMMEFATEDNFIFSPVSLSTALNIHSKLEPENQKLNKYLDRDYLSYRYDKKYYKSVNRIWINKDRDIEIPNSIKKYAYRMDMSDSSKATKEKNDYVAKETNNFIKKTPTILSSDTIFDIMNVLYFKDTWKNGDLSETYEPVPFNGKYSQSEITMMYANSEYYYENDSAYVIPLEYEHKNRMLLIYPKEGIEDVSFNGILENKVNQPANITFPGFETELSFTPDALTEKLGLDTKVVQTVKIKVDKEGTEAAAVTEDVKDMAMEPQDQLSLTFDKPFMYAIEDTQNGDIAFMGKIEQL